jgi:hypothetical protein
MHSPRRLLKEAAAFAHRLLRTGRHDSASAVFIAACTYRVEPWGLLRVFHERPERLPNTPTDPRPPRHLRIVRGDEVPPRDGHE